MNQDQIIEKRIKDKDDRIDRVIAIKEKSIAYFNSVNSAIAFVDALLHEKNDIETIQQEIRRWRNWFYEEWQNWYQIQTKPRTITDEGITWANEEFQKKYNQNSQLDDINREIEKNKKS